MNEKKETQENLKDLQNSTTCDIATSKSTNNALVDNNAKCEEMTNDLNNTLSDVTDDNNIVFEEKKSKNVIYDEEYEKNKNITDVLITGLAENGSKEDAEQVKTKFKPKYQIKPALGYLRHVIMPIIVYSSICGLIVGTLVGLYTKLASLLSHWSVDIYGLVQKHPAYTPLFLLGLVVIALLCYLLLRITPECKGSGVPRTEGVLRGILTFRWLRVLLTTIASSLLTYFGGLSLGSEGPSIQIGATTAQGACRLLKCRMAWSKYIMSAGAGTGLAVAFNAPLTGIIFVIEEVHKKVSPMLVLTAGCCVTVGVLTSNAISLLWGGTGYLFNFGLFPDSFDFKNLWMLVVLGIVIGLASVGFNYIIINSQKYLSKFKIPQWFKLVFAFLLCGAVGLVLTDTIGGGHELIMNIGEGKYIWWMLLILLAVKMILIPVSFNSGATGGLFIPMLTIGALIGGLLGKLFNMAGLEPELYKLIVVISMSAFFGACVRTPVTAMVLIMEVTGCFHSFLFTGITIFTATVIAELFKVSPLYDALLENNIKNEFKDKKQVEVSFKLKVAKGSFSDGKEIKDLLWPPECAIKNIFRGKEKLLASADTKIQGDDILLIKAKTYSPDETLEYVDRLLNE